jgi:predicted phage-related endonuclease
MPPTIKVHPRYDFLIASLDGFNEEHKLVLEIKVAGREVFEAAKAGEVHEKYYPQVQHQLACSGGKENHFFVCRAERNLSEHVIVDAALVRVKPDEAFIKDMIAKELEFYKLVQEKISPPLMDRDVMFAEDEATVMLFGRLKKAKLFLDQVDKKHDLVFQQLEAAKAEFEQIKKEAIVHATKVLKHINVASVGVCLRKSKNGVWSVKVETCNEV